MPSPLRRPEKAINCLKVYQPRHIYDCHHQRGESKDVDGMEVTHSVKCPSGLPNGILEKEGGAVIRREQLSCHIDENLQTSVVRKSISNEESVIDCDVHERCGSSPSWKRKRSLVNMDADMSTRNYNEDTPNMLANGTSSLDNCYKPVRKSETCLKWKREDNNPKKQGVHSCNAEVRDETQDTANNGHPGKTNSVQQMTPSMHLEANDHKKMCLTCGLGGKLLYCNGKGCNQVYHISCLQPPMVYLPFGSWHCSFCIRKKGEAGVYAISPGLESIWDAREVSDVEGGMKTEKQYLVKYKGLAHVHNRWIEEGQLVQEAPSLLLNFHTAKVARWNSDWAIPHHLLCNRDLIFTISDDDCRNKDELMCHHEWLVKWCGLGYEHATWELDNAPFLCSPEGQCRIRDYEERYQRAKRILTHSTDDMILVQDLPVGSFPGFDDNHLDAVNKLRQRWHKNLNAIIFYDQTLQGEGSSSTFNGMRCVDATVGKKQSQLVEQPYPANDNALSERMNCQELAEKNGFSLEKSLSSRLEPFHLLAANSSQHYPCSTEIVSHNLMQPIVQTIVNAAGRSNLVSAEPASNPEPCPLGDPTVTGLPNVLCEARSTLSTSDNNRPLQSALQMVSRIPPPSHMDPLQNEIERIKKEMEQEKKKHEDMKLCLKSDCEKEIEEVITQIRRKYDVKFQEIEVGYLNKKTAFDTSQNAVLMHKILAEAFRSKCMDLKLPRALGSQQDASHTQQQLVQLSRLQITHRPPMVVATPSSSVPLAPCPQNMLNTINLQRLVPAVQAAHNQSTAFSSISTRPQISSKPLPPTVNIQSICEIHAPAPHLQPYMPSSSLVTTNLSILTHGISNQQVPSNNVVAAASIPQLPTCTPASNYQSGPQNRPPWAEIAGGISCPNASLSALELLMDVDNGSSTVMPENLSPNSTPTAGTSEIVYLSDDD